MIAPILLAMLAVSVPSEAVVLVPDLVEVAPDRPYADVSLRNVGTSPREILADALSWTQDDEGKVTLAPTESVSMFPRRAELLPGEERRFRLTVVARAPVRPGAYRIGFTVHDPATGERVVALIPAFVLPERPVESAAVRVACPGRSSCEVSLYNTGNVQLRPARIALTIGTGAADDAETELDAWWVLPGGARNYRLEVEPSAEPRQVRVRVSLGDVELSAAATLTP